MNMNEGEIANIFNSFNKRKDNALKPLHFAAALLDPSHQGSHLTKEQQIDGMEFTCKVSTDMKLDSVANVMTDFANYRTKQNMWSKPFLWSCSQSTSPIAWWGGLCGATSLAKVARRIIMAPVSSAETERSFKTFSFIHKKKETY